MIATLRMECIGDDMDRALAGRSAVSPRALVAEAMRMTYWVAELAIDSTGRSERRFLKPKRDYSRADEHGRRGVFAYYTLHSGRLYEVQERITWRQAKRYYARVTVAGQIVVVPSEAVEELRRRKAATHAR